MKKTLKSSSKDSVVIPSDSQSIHRSFLFIVFNSTQIYQKYTESNHHNNLNHQCHTQEECQRVGGHACLDKNLDDIPPILPIPPPHPCPRQEKKRKDAADISNKMKY